MREFQAWIFAVLVAFAALLAGHAAEKNGAPADSEGCDPTLQQCVGENAYGLMEPGG